MSPLSPLTPVPPQPPATPPTRWCPTCGEPFTGIRLTCPKCLTRLVDDKVGTGTRTCRHCGRVSPARMHSCPGCLAQFEVDAEEVTEAMTALLASGRRIPRPVDVPAFRDGPDCTLVRPAPRSGLVYAGLSGLMEATIDSDGNRAAPPLRCLDLDGSLLFRLVTYPAAARAVVAIDGNGAALATFIDGPVSDLSFDVRDETSAPIGRVRPAGGREGGWELVETGASRLATLSSIEVERDEMLDDEWSLQTLAADLPMKPLAAVAMVLAAKVFLGRAQPVPSPRARWERSLDEEDLGLGGLRLGATGLRWRLF